jgi:hypothetical protein
MLALHLPFNFNNSYIAFFNDLVLTLLIYDSIIQPILCCVYFQIGKLFVDVTLRQNLTFMTMTNMTSDHF